MNRAEIAHTLHELAESALVLPLRQLSAKLTEIQAEVHTLEAAEIAAAELRANFPRYLIEAVAAHAHIAPERLMGDQRSQDLVVWRQLGIALMREMTDLSTPAIGRLWHRDHSTVVYAVQKVQRRYPASFLAELREKIQSLMESKRGLPCTATNAATNIPAMTCSSASNIRTLACSAGDATASMKPTSIDSPR